MTEEQLLERLKNGDEKAFKILIENHQRMVFTTCYALVHNVADADDLAQEVFIEVFRSCRQFRGDAKLSTWIYRISVNKSLNMIRKNRYRKLLKPLETIFGTETSITDHELATDRLEARELSGVLHQAIDALPENQRVAFLLNKYELLSYKEIADVMETSVSGVESLLHRAKSNLRKRLTNYHEIS